MGDTMIVDAGGNTIVAKFWGEPSEAGFIVAAVNTMTAVKRWRDADERANDGSRNNRAVHKELGESHEALMTLLSELDLDILSGVTKVVEEADESS